MVGIAGRMTGAFASILTAGKNIDDSESVGWSKNFVVLIAWTIIGSFLTL